MVGVRICVDMMEMPFRDDTASPKLRVAAYLGSIAGEGPGLASVAIPEVLNDTRG